MEPCIHALFHVCDLSPALLKNPTKKLSESISILSNAWYYIYISLLIIGGNITMTVEKEYQLIFTCRTARPFSAPTAQDLQHMDNATRTMCQVVQFRCERLDELSIGNAVARGLCMDEYELDMKDFYNAGNGYMNYTRMENERGHPVRGDIEQQQVYIVDYTFYIRELVPVDLARLAVFVH